MNCRPFISALIVLLATMSITAQEVQSVEVQAAASQNYGLNTTAQMVSAIQTAPDGLATYKVACDVVPQTGKEIVSQDDMSFGKGGDGRAANNEGEFNGAAEDSVDIGNIQILEFNANGGSLTIEDISFSFESVTTLNAHNNNDRVSLVVNDTEFALGKTAAPVTVLDLETETQLTDISVFTIGVGSAAGGNRWDITSIGVKLTFPEVLEIPLSAKAGDDQSVEGNSLVTLDGSGSTAPEGQTITYQWTAPEGITLSSETEAMPTFTAEDVTVETPLEFSLTVSDDSETSEADLVTVTVTPLPLLANAGDDVTVDATDVVTLDGSASSGPGGLTLTYLWTAPEGITLSSDTEAMPTFTAPDVSADEVFDFSLVVNNGVESSAADMVSVTVKSTAPLPLTSSVIDLQATASTNYGVDNIAQLVSSTYFASDGIATFQLAVDVQPQLGKAIISGSSLGGTATVNSFGLGGDARAGANEGEFHGASADSVDIGNIQILNFNSNGGNLTVEDISFKFENINITNGQSAGRDDISLIINDAETNLANLAANPTTVILEDATGLVDISSFTIGVGSDAGNNRWQIEAIGVELTFAGGLPLNAFAGDDISTEGGSVVTLDGSGSTAPEGQTITYQWTAPDGITLSSNTDAMPTFTAPDVTVETTLEFSLTVSDDSETSEADMVSVTITPKPVTADAGSGQTVNAGESVTLDGSASSAPGGQSVTYLWTAPEGITLSSTTDAMPTFTAPDVSADEVFEFSLVVNNGVEDSAPDMVSVTVKSTVPLTLTTPFIDIQAAASTAYGLNTVAQFVSSTYYATDGIATFQVGIDVQPKSGKGIVSVASKAFGNEGGDNRVSSHVGEFNGAYGDSVIVSNIQILNFNANGGDFTKEEISGLFESISTVNAQSAPDNISLIIDETPFAIGSLPDNLLDLETATSLTDISTFTIGVGTLASNNRWQINAIGIELSFEGGFGVPLTAIAGEDLNATSDDLVTLDGSASTAPEGQIISYMWTAPAEITLSSTTEAMPTFTAPIVTEETTYEFSLIVNDANDTSDPDLIIVTVTPVPLVADAGNDFGAFSGNLVTLDASGSTAPHGSTITYQWTAPEGITLSSTTEVMPTFTAPDVTDDETFEFSLVVSAGGATSDPAIVVVTVASGDAISLESPFIDIRALANTDYGVGNVAQMISPLYFTPDEIGTFQVAISVYPQAGKGIVSGDKGLPSTTESTWGLGGQSDGQELRPDNNVALFYGALGDSVDIRDIEIVNFSANGGAFTEANIAAKFNSISFANAHSGGDNVSIEVNGFDVNLMSLAEPVTTINLLESVGFDDVTEFTIGVGSAATNNRWVVEAVGIELSYPGVAILEANAGEDFTTLAGNTATLDGSASTAPQGQTLTYEWTAPDGVTLSSTTAAMPTFTAPAVDVDSDIEFSLEVSADGKTSFADVVVVKVLKDASSSNGEIKALSNNDYGVDVVATMISEIQFAPDGLATYQIAIDVTPRSGESIVSGASGGGSSSNSWGIGESRVFSGGNMDGIQEIGNIRVINFESNGGLTEGDISALRFTQIQIADAETSNDFVSFIVDGEEYIRGWLANNPGYLDMVDLIGSTEITSFSIGPADISDLPNQTQDFTQNIWSVESIIVDVRFGDILSSPDTNNQISIYPNPANGLVNITRDADYLEVINMSGKIVQKLKVNNHQFNVSSLKSGIYFLRTAVDGRTFTTRFIKSNN